MVSCVDQGFVDVGFFPKNRIALGFHSYWRIVVGDFKKWCDAFCW